MLSQPDNYDDVPKLNLAKINVPKLNLAKYEQ